ncbi:hypothetical protein M2447_002777 [Ereboglobus sp. PH5-10]|uniref:hypothetical protein n=1 Tax=Ereboglobus sp. PH5-10 TaxID=2940629 RepID=UPI0024051B50|nr:hypothetical protein [Ereboglobus sp. PH5-10]MDF9828649.1 hypothetical protein [Ereboglobus sp. PH5-10]
MTQHSISPADTSATPDNKKRVLTRRERLHALIGKLLGITPRQLITRSQLDVEVARALRDFKIVPQDSAAGDASAGACKNQTKNTAIFFIQSKGALGKTFCCAHLYEYLKNLGHKFLLHNADSISGELVKIFPETIPNRLKIDRFENQDLLFDSLREGKNIIADFEGGFAVIDAILDVFIGKFDFEAFCNETGTKLILIVPVDGGYANTKCWLDLKNAFPWATFYQIRRADDDSPRAKYPEHPPGRTLFMPHLSGGDPVKLAFYREGLTANMLANRLDMIDAINAKVFRDMLYREFAKLLNHIPSPGTRR